MTIQPNLFRIFNRLFIYVLQLVILNHKIVALRLGTVHASYLPLILFKTNECGQGPNRGVRLFSFSRKEKTNFRKRPYCLICTFLSSEIWSLVSVACCTLLKASLLQGNVNVIHRRLFGYRCRQLPLIEKLPQWLSGPSSPLSVTAGPLVGNRTRFKWCSDAQCFIQLLA